MNVPYLNFWIDLNNLFLEIQENKYLDTTIIYERLTLEIIDEDRISIRDYKHGVGISFTKVDDNFIVEDRFLHKEYKIQNLDCLLKDIRKSLSECNTESDVVAFLKLCSNDTNFLKIKDIPYPEIFSLPSKSISLLEEYF